jgi:hypothetical protein
MRYNDVLRLDLVVMLLQVEERNRISKLLSEALWFFRNVVVRDYFQVAQLTSLPIFSLPQGVQLGMTIREGGWWWPLAWACFISPCM